MQRPTPRRWQIYCGALIPPDAYELRGQPSRSERLTEALRDNLDRPARSLQEFIKRATARPDRPGRRARSDPEAIKRELGQLGVESP
ncbi:hypothetical protein NJB1604_18710 [Mycobacterium marinum]|nr:hypothetical protein NJB1604_18710 [Mycobacterium marinum]